MSERGDWNQVPALRADSVAPMQSTRLVKRGSEILELREMISLEVIELVACESSVFVLSTDWDRDADFARRVADWERDRPWSQREVVLYEFSLAGEFVQKLRLQLIQLTAEGYSKITGREPGTFSVRSSFVHFYEILITSEFSRPVRVNYLFSRSGERLAVWSNEEFVDRYRLAAEPFSPSQSGVRPDFVTEQFLVRMDSELRFKPPSDERVERSRVQRVGTITVDQMTYLAANPAKYQSSGRTYSTLLEQPTSEFHEVRFPSEETWVDNRLFLAAWQCDAIDDTSIWFMNQWSNGGRVIWKLDFTSGEPSVRLRHFPSPYSLIESGLLHAPEYWPVPLKGQSAHDSDELDEGEDSYGYHELIEEIREEELEFGLMLEPKRLYASQGDLLAVFECYEPQSQEAIEDIVILFEVDDHNVRPVKDIDPYSFHYSDLFSMWASEHADKDDQERHSSYSRLVSEPSREHPSLGDLEHHAFVNGKLLSTNLDWDHRNKIIVTDVYSEKVSWFTPMVPDTEDTSGTSRQIRL